MNKNLDGINTRADITARGQEMVDEAHSVLLESGDRRAYNQTQDEITSWIRVALDKVIENE